MVSEFHSTLGPFPRSKRKIKRAPKALLFAPLIFVTLLTGILQLGGHQQKWQASDHLSQGSKKLEGEQRGFHKESQLMISFSNLSCFGKAQSVAGWAVQSCSALPSTWAFRAPPKTGTRNVWTVRSGQDGQDRHVFKSLLKFLLYAMYA